MMLQLMQVLVRPVHAMEIVPVKEAVRFFGREREGEHGQEEEGDYPFPKCLHKAKIRFSFCLVLQNGVAAITESGETLTGDVQLGNGAVLDPNGTITHKNGEQIHIGLCSCVKKSGRIVPMHGKKGKACTKDARPIETVSD